MTSKDIRQNVSDKLIEAMQTGVLPWRRPCSSNRSSGRHRNFATNRPYSGVNPLLLELHCLRHGFSANRWMTFNQAKEMECSVMKRPADVPAGQWGCNVILCRPVKKTVVDDKTGEETDNRFMILRNFTVFNIEQIAGEAVDRIRTAEPTISVGPDYPEVHSLIEGTQANIRHGGDRAFYNRPIPEGTWPNHQDGDCITLPERRAFDSSEGYFETALHELAHWSEVRLDWDHRKHGYAMGELVAEISSAYLGAELGLPSNNLNNHAAYLQSWLEGMKGNPSFIFSACSAASKTTDFLLSFVRPSEEPAVEDELLATASA